MRVADALIGLIGQSYYDALAELTAFPSGPEAEEIDDPEVEGDFGPTFKEQLVRARRGQGVFRSSVLLSETECRVTRVSDPKHLRASHIKPWREANNAERLDGSNGLLLSPHIDHLFDQGYISFSNTEELLVVPAVRAKRSRTVAGLERSCLELPRNAGRDFATGRTWPPVAGSRSRSTLVTSLWIETGCGAWREAQR